MSYAAARAKKHVNPFTATAAILEDDHHHGGSMGAHGRQNGPSGPVPKRAVGGLSGDAALRVPTREVYERYCGLCKVQEDVGET